MENEKYLEQWNTTNAARLLQSDETVEQMINHNPAYFITSSGRIISLLRKEPKVMEVFYGGSKNVSQVGNRNRPRVCLRVMGESKCYYIHRLMAEYFPIDQFIRDDSAPAVVHHKNPSAPPEEINRSENLIKVDEDTHQVLTTMERQQGERWQLPSEEQSLKVMSKLLALGIGNAVLYEKIDKATGKVLETSVGAIKEVKKCGVREERTHQKHQGDD